MRARWTDGLFAQKDKTRHAKAQSTYSADIQDKRLRLEHFQGLERVFVRRNFVPQQLQPNLQESLEIAVSGKKPGWQFLMCCIIIWHHYCNPTCT